MAPRRRLPWGLSVPLIVAGSLAAHSLGSMVVAARVSAPVDAHGGADLAPRVDHGYVTILPVLVGLVSGLWTVRSSDAGDLQRVTATPSGAFDVPNGYSPDGSRILFSRFRRDEAPGVLFSVKPNGNGILRLTPRGLRVLDFLSRHLGASWSADSSRITFAGEERSTGKDALYVENADGTGLHRITPTSMSALSAQWSPDGRLIAFTGGCKTPAFCQAWVIRPDGTGLSTPVPAISGSFSRLPVWSPDSRKLLFIRNINGVRTLWAANARGGGLSKVTDLDLPLEYAWGTAPLG